MNVEVSKSLIVLVCLSSLAGCGGEGGGPDAVVPPVNHPPVAAISGPTTGYTGASVSLDGSASSDPDGDALAFRWTMTVPTGSSASLAGSTTAHVILLPDVVGTYQLSLVVSDGKLDSVPANHTLTATARSPIKATLRTPLADGLVSDAVAVIVTVVSTYEVSSVTATLAGAETVLTFAPDAWCQRVSCGPGFVGTPSLAGQPPGTYTLTINATDVRGNSDQFSVNIVHDNPPVLTVTAPLDESVALPTVPLEARCTDDLPGCAVELRVNDQLQQSAPSALSGPFDLSAWLGQTVKFELFARDSANQVTRQVLTVFVESPTRLAVVAELPGSILDADSRHLLFVEHADAGDVLAIYDRVSGLTEAISMPDGRTVRTGSAYLTPSGAIFVTQATAGNVSTSRVYLWRAGTFTDLAYPNSAASLEVSGDYAIWNEDGAAYGGNLYRLDTATGTSELVASNAGNIENSVSADGTVAFWNTNYQVVLDQSGQQDVLTNDASQWHVYPLTDGDRVLYRRQDPCCANQQYAIVLIEGADSIPLTAKRDLQPSPGRDYQIRNGWAAYTDLGNLGQLHVFTRSPLGLVTRHTDLGTSSRLDRLAGNGELMLINGQQRFFSRGSGLLEVSSAAGHGYWLNGAWYVAIGRALLAVDTGG